jgi:predicted DNA-binding ribbon-helix-helix protein
MARFHFHAPPGSTGCDLAMITKRGNEKAGDIGRARKADDGRSKPEPAKRSLAVGGRKTSVRLEDALWNELRAMARERNVSVSELLNRIDIKRKRGNLSSAVRLFLSSLRRKRR